MESWDVPGLPEWVGPQAAVSQSGVRFPGVGEPDTVWAVMCCDV